MSNILSIILMVLPSYLIVVTVHEIGHILSGLIHGFKFYLFVIGPFGLMRNKHDRVVFYFEKNPTLWGGIAGILPKTENSGNFRAFAAVLIAGPLCNLIFGGITLYLFFLFGKNFLLLLGAMSLAISVTTLIPLRAGLFYSDGGRWLRIVGNTRERAVELALYNLVQSEIVHQTCAHINVADTEILIEHKDPREQYIGFLYAMKYYKEHSCYEMEEMCRLELKKLEDKVPKSFIKLMVYDSDT